MERFPKIDHGCLEHIFGIPSRLISTFAGLALTMSRAINSQLRVRSLTSRFIADQAGAIMITFALVFPVLLLGIGSAIDYGQLYSKRTSLQTAADNAALTGASEHMIANRDATDIEAAVNASLKVHLKDMPGTVKIAISVSENPASITVELKQSPGMYFMDTLLGNRTTVIGVSATARIVGSTRICVLTLDDRAAGAFSAETNSRLSANGCAVYSNSSSSQSIVAKNSAAVKASLICASGGVNGDAHFYPTPLTDCPTMEDPLADRPAPPIGACNHSWLAIEGGTVTLSPGVYCGGISITGGAQVFFNPGVYIIKDGPLIAAQYVTMKGENVGFYLTGSKALVKLTPMSSISLTAPKDGPLAGLLFFEDRERKTTATHVISSNDARLLLGTIYLPAGNLVIDAKSPIADQSAYTVIIASTLKLYDGPHLILNTDYGATDIPVPEGIQDMGNAVALTK